MLDWRGVFHWFGWGRSFLAFPQQFQGVDEQESEERHG